MTPERDIAERLLTGEPCLEANGRPCRSMDAQSGCACAEAAAEINRLRTALADVEAKLEQVRQILAGTSVGSLPNDYPVERLALETWNTLQERTLEGLAMIGKVEAAEADLVKAREALTKAADHIEGVTGSNERPGSDSAEIVDEVRATLKSLTDT